MATAIKRVAPITIPSVADLPARAQAELDRLHAQVLRSRCTEKRETAERDRRQEALDEATARRTRLEGQAEQVWIDEPRRLHPSTQRRVEAHWEPNIAGLPMHQQAEYSKLSEAIDQQAERLTGANRKLASAEHELEKAEQALMLAERWLGEGLAMVGAAVDAAAERQQAIEEEARLEKELAAAKSRRERAENTWGGCEYRIVQAGGKGYLHDIMLSAAQQQKDELK